MSAKNSNVDHECSSKKANASSLRSKNSIEQERRRKLVKFNAVADIKEMSDDSTASKVNQDEEMATTSEPATSNLAKDKKDSSFNSKRRNHYKNEFTNSKTSKDLDQD